MSAKSSITDFPVETASINDLVPIGIPQAWPHKSLPSSNFVWVHGQEFDLAANPKLAVLYPSGRLPDPRWDFFRYVGTDQEALTKQEQSVQPLGFVADPHTHDVVSGTSQHNLDSGKYRAGFASKTVATEPAIVTGTITGTGTETKPQCMLWYCIMRVI